MGFLMSFAYFYVFILGSTAPPLITVCSIRERSLAWSCIALLALPAPTMTARSRLNVQSFYMQNMRKDLALVDFVKKC